jgi:hypothetical protein
MSIRISTHLTSEDANKDGEATETLERYLLTDTANTLTVVSSFVTIRRAAPRGTAARATPWPWHQDVDAWGQQTRRVAPFASGTLSST